MTPSDLLRIAIAGCQDSGREEYAAELQSLRRALESLTWEDVDLLRTAADAVIVAGESHDSSPGLRESRDEHDRLLGLADRLARLLPPREP